MNQQIVERRAKGRAVLDLSSVCGHAQEYSADSAIFEIGCCQWPLGGTTGVGWVGSNDLARGVICDYLPD